MTDKVLLNKNSLALLKNELEEYQNILPVFEMKEKELKAALQSIEHKIDVLKEQVRINNTKTKKWAAVMAEDVIDLEILATISKIDTHIQETAGLNIQTVQGIEFTEPIIDQMNLPFWIGAAQNSIRKQSSLMVKLDIQLKNQGMVEEELAEARRMKNALKEVFIPETKAKIRKIEIYLGDVERLSIGCAKLVKKKKQQKTVEA